MSILSPEVLISILSLEILLLVTPLLFAFASGWSSTKESVAHFQLCQNRLTLILLQMTIWDNHWYVVDVPHCNL